MDRHSARRGVAGQAARGRQWSRHFPVLTVVLGGILAACGSSTKETNTVDPGPPVNLVAFSATSQNTLINSSAGIRPSVKVTDADGISVPGVQVVFAVTGGGGSLTDAVRSTNAQGIATVGSWTMGPTEGINTVTASSDGLTGSPRTFTATASTTVSNFTIKLNYLLPGTPAEEAVFENAKNRWQAVITGDLTNFTVSPGTVQGGDSDVCGSGTAVNETIDDLMIQVAFDSIDGPGDVLGFAGPCLVRPTNAISGAGLSIVGQMTFDSSDAPTALNNGSFQDIVLHEMGHVLGIGSLWQRAQFNFLSGACTSNPQYTGPQALSAYKTANGGGAATSVPVENFNNGSCPNGTRDSHWRETVFGDELMTGFISGLTRPMSLTTIRSLADLGYTVDNSQADPFTAPNPNGALRDPRSLGPMISLHNDVRTQPIYVLEEVNRTTYKLRRLP